jgi:LemA protein
MIYIGLGILLLILVAYIIVMYNSFVKTNILVEEAFSTMDVCLKKRWDLIPNLVEVVKGYAKHEKTTLEELVNLRNGIYDDLSNSEKINTNVKINESLSKIMVIVENYPELKANENFLDLSKQLVLVEDEISKSRRYYNAVVKNYNNKVRLIPSNLVALIFGFKEKNMFEASEEERENVKIDL